ncbi:MAG: lamin tail domain-containing protein, partial [Planctomycetota bacterium]
MSISMRILLLTFMLTISLVGSVRADFPVGDLNGDCDVNLTDLGIFVDQWLDPPGCSAHPNDCANLDAVNGINMADFALLAAKWLVKTGSLQVTILPPEAVTTEAQWRVDGSTWRDSDYTETCVKVGTHTVEYKPIIGWNEPNSQVVQIDDGQTATTTGTYVQQTGSLQVTVLPQAADDDGAQWRVYGGTWRDSNEIESGLPVGWYTVEFSDINGWTKPADQIVKINYDQRTTTSGAYVQQTHVQLKINEFMASNASAEPLEEGELLDGDDQSSDWIEIYNPTDADVNLNGWYLTDSVANLTMWQFPDGLQIEAGEFLVVFASGKTYEENPLNYPYLDSLGYYHTNFELDKDLGEYLALVAPDGNTVVHEYAPEFPYQLTNISYGLAQYATTLVPISVIASYHVPTSADAVLGTGWATPDFNDSEWDTGETGIGFGLGGERMVAYNDCVYRSSDQYIADNVTTYGIGSGYTSLTSGPLVDQVTGDDMGVTVMLTQSGGVTWKPKPDAGGSDCAVGTDAYNTFGGTTDMTGVIYYGSVGWWVDLTFTGLDPTTEYTFATSTNRGNPNYTNRWTIYTLTGADTYTNASTSGVDVLAENKVRFNTGDNYNQGYVARWTGITASDGSFTVRAEADPSSADGRRAYSFDVFMLEGGPRGTDVQDDMLGVNASLWMRTEFNLEEEEAEIFDVLTLRMKYEDGFVAYINGQEVASRNSPNSVEWNSTADSNRPIEDSLAFEEINLMAFVDTLQTGRNALAIHGLNDDVADPNFLILPELVAASNMSVPQYYVRPTPETFNVVGAMGIVSDVWFSHERGFYDTGFQLMLSTAMDDAEIRYTIDGSCPTITNGLTYTYPIDVNRTTTVRAVAVKSGWLPAHVDAHTYIFLFDVANQPEFPPGLPTSWAGYTADYGVDPDVINTTLPGYSFEEALLWIPSICITMPSEDLFSAADGIYVYSTSKGDQWERPASIELIYPDGRDGFQINAGTHLHGGSSRRHDRTLKHSFRLVFRGIYGSTKLNFPLFPDSDVERFDQLVLRASSGDSWSYPDEYHHDAPEHIKEQAQYTRDPWMKDTQRAMGHHSAHSIFVHLYLNGLYWGQYNLCERVNNSFQASYYGGDKEEYDVIHDRDELQSGTMDVWNQMFDLAAAGLASDEDAQFIQGNNPDGTRNPDYPIILNVDSLIDYMILHIYARVDDWPCHNFWAARRQGPLSEGFRFFVWDQENHTNALNRLITGCGIHLEILPNEVSRSILPAYPYAKLRDNAEFRLKFSDRVHKYMFNGGLLTPEKNEERWMKRATEIDKSVVAESARWGDAQLDDPPRDEPYKREVEWLATQDWIRTVYWPQIGDLVLERYRGVGLYPDIHAPVFRINDVYQHGGQASSGDELTMDNPNGSGTIYYTVDGSDPREPFTGNAVGTPYSPVTLNKSTHVKARVRDGGVWSALNEAIFAIGPVADGLRVTEIMYHPKYTGDPNDPNEEFIELKNIGLNTLNLNLVRFTEGIDFTFPDIKLEPNECVVVAKDQSAFEAQYGTSVNIAGQYTGSLANNGEQIRLQDAIGQTIMDFEYEDGWRPITDGDNFSLTIIDPTNSDPNSWSEKDSWRASVYRNGSPGSDDSGILPNPGAVVINEVMSHSNAGPDWIELYNTSDEAINIGGWFLSDNDRDE